MIEIEDLVKSFGSKQALAGVSFTAPAGAVTGFLGPNGAGKSTTMRSVLGLIRPDRGSIRVDGQAYVRQAAPLASIGAVLDAKSAHPHRSAYDHLRAIALTHGIPKARVDEVIDLAGIRDVKGKHPGGFSLGMNQRLSIAAALLADPDNLVLDEPVNGLDPEGVKWVRDLCRWYAGLGRTVLLSSHLMSEVAQTADNLVIIGRGRVMKITTVSQFIAENSTHTIRLTSPDGQAVGAAVASLPGASLLSSAPAASTGGATTFAISGTSVEQLATALTDRAVRVYELVEERVSLEDAYMKLTHDEVEYRSHIGEPPTAAASTRPLEVTVRPALATAAQPVIAEPTIARPVIAEPTAAPTESEPVTTEVADDGLAVDSPVKPVAAPSGFALPGLDLPKLTLTSLNSSDESGGSDPGDSSAADDLSEPIEPAESVDLSGPIEQAQGDTDQEEDQQ